MQWRGKLGAGHERGVPRRVTSDSLLLVILRVLLLALLLVLLLVILRVLLLALLLGLASTTARIAVALRGTASTLWGTATQSTFQGRGDAASECGKNLP